MRVSMLVVLAAVQVTCSPPTPEIGAERDALIQADRAFHRATADRGAAGWAEFVAEDARQFLDGGPVVGGRAAIHDLMTRVFERPGSSLWWDPTFADVAASGDLGYTTGIYRSTTTTDAGDTVTVEGKYVTIWRKQPDDSWLVVLDIGNQGQ